MWFRSATYKNEQKGQSMQNTSHAVMAQRTEDKDSLDNFPTPPWATRALIEHVIERGGYTDRLTALEPACGAGHMASVLKEYFQEVDASDIHPYGYGSVQDFSTKPYEAGSFDWVITNPPFKLAEEFIARALPIARRGVAMLTRTVFIESVGRYERLFSKIPPTKVAQFVERVPMVKGRLDRKASTATGYTWIVWEKVGIRPTELVWIPPCRKILEKDSDYLENKISSSVDLKQETIKDDLLLI
jgi:predicted RNA methylase